MKKAKSNYQDLLKAVALIAMIIDHAGLYLFPDEVYMRVIGRYSMPIFLFFVGYNFNNNIRIKILVYGVILQIITLFFIFKAYVPANILITIFLGLLCLKALQEYLKNFWIGYLFVIILGCLWDYTDILFDYGTYGICVTCLGYMVKQHPKEQYLLTFAVVIIAFMHTYFIFDTFNQFEFLLAIIISCLCFISLNAVPYDNRIPIRFVSIRCNLLEIYFIHVLLLQIIWLYIHR